MALLITEMTAFNGALHISAIPPKIVPNALTIPDQLPDHIELIRESAPEITLEIPLTAEDTISLITEKASDTTGVIATITFAINWNAEPKGGKTDVTIFPMVVIIVEKIG